MAKFKFDVKEAKEFASKRYEVVALGGAGVLAVICLFWGVSAFFSDSSPEQKILDDANKLARARESAPVEELGKGNLKPVSDWKAVTPQQADLTVKTPFFLPGMAGSSLRFNPKILNIDNDAKSFQLDYINQGIYAYDGVDERGEKLRVFKAENMASMDAVFVINQKRMVVVSATFPYLDQAEIYRKALRFERIEELFYRGLAPAFEGLNVQRRKITTAGGKAKPGEWENIYMADANGKVEVTKGIAQLMQTCVIDENQVDKYYDII